MGGYIGKFGSATSILGYKSSYMVAVKGVLFFVIENWSRAESRMTCLGQIIEYSVLRYGIFSHGELALAGNCFPTNRIGCAFLMSVEENELLLGGVGREIGEGIHQCTGYLSTGGCLFMSPRDLSNNLTPTPPPVVNTPTRGHPDT